MRTVQLRRMELVVYDHLRLEVAQATGKSSLAVVFAAFLEAAS
ncbi:MAG: hypothetical protein ACKVH8_25280 [Pirellulales bacterium]